MADAAESIAMADTAGTVAGAAGGTVGVADIADDTAADIADGAVADITAVAGRASFDAFFPIQRLFGGFSAGAASSTGGSSTALGMPRVSRDGSCFCAF